MIKRFPLYLLLSIVLTGVVVSCNDDDDYTSFTIDDSELFNVSLNSFSLAADDSVLENLDTVFFSIDLDKGRVYNADSLPKGTNISRLLVNIGLPTVSSAKLIVPNPVAGVPDTINYLETQKDSVDFSNGPVTLRVISYNQLRSIDYKIQVNVHEMDPDSLYWNETSSMALPGGIENPLTQSTVELGGNYYTFVAEGAHVVRSMTTNPATGVWTSMDVELPAGAEVGTITSAGTALYLSDRAGMLYKSEDAGETWSETGVAMSHIYGSHGNSVFGVRHNDDDSYTFVTYPATAEMAIPANCPVSGTSQSITYTTEWSEEMMTIVMGGRTASGSLSGDVWAYDGSNWSKITQSGVPATEGMVVVPYFTFKTDDTWVVTRETVLLAFSGRQEKGVFNTVTYMSSDRGLNWKKADASLQLPSYIPKMVGAQGLVVENTIESKAASTWMYYGDGMMSRATAPITSWECPYIYLFGGKLANGNVSTTIWRGVINRLSFKPIQ